LFINNHSSTNPANLPKIGLVDIEITGLTKIVKNIYKNEKEIKGGPKKRGHRLMTIIFCQILTDLQNFSPEDFLVNL